MQAVGKTGLIIQTCVVCAVSLPAMHTEVNDEQGHTAENIERDSHTNLSQHIRDIGMYDWVDQKLIEGNCTHHYKE